AEALDRRLEITGLHPRQEEVRVAEPGMHLHRQRGAGRLVRLERRRHRVTHGRAFDPSTERRRITWPECFEVEAAAVGGDRLQAYEPVLACGRDFSAQSVEAVLLGNALYAEHRTRGAVRELAELIPRRAFSRRRIAVVYEQPLRTTDGEIGVCERRAQRIEQELVGREGVKRVFLRRRQAIDAAPIALLLVDRRRIDLDRLGRLQAALETVQPGRDQPSDREV